MDYEKKYKDALERAKYYKEGITDRKLEEGENIMDYIFPELKEMEDERVRKGIIEYLEQSQFGEERYQIDDNVVRNYIAWLEKQSMKEQDVRHSCLEDLLASDDIYQMAMNDAMVEKARTKAVNALSKLAIGELLGIEKQVEQKPTKEQVWDYCSKISSEWWQITMDKWNALADEDKNKYNQFIGFNDFSDTLMNITAGALFQLIDTGKLEYEEGSLLLEKPDDTPKPLETRNAMNEKQGGQKSADKVEPKVQGWRYYQI